MVRLPGEETWSQDWNEFEGAFEAHAAAEAGVAQLPAPATQTPTPGFVERTERAIGQQPAAPPAEAAPMPDPSASEMEAIRRRWLTPQDEPDLSAGSSPFAQELEREGFFARREAEHAEARETVRQEAVRESTEQSLFSQWAADAAREAPRWAAQHVRQWPGSLMTGAGSALQGPDTVVAGVEQTHQDMRWRRLQIYDRIDRGEEPLPRLRGEVRDRRWDDVIRAYQNMPPEQRVATRSALQAEILSFNPTPVQERSLYRTGERLQTTGRGLVPHLEGYDESSVATQLARGLGSMVIGLPATWAFGPAGGAVVFGSMGIGEATQRAVEFDRGERTAGRPGLTQDQIVLAGLWGVGPGTTDVLPIENLVRQLRLPGMSPFIANTLAQAIGRVGGRAFMQAAVEGGQETLQQFMQNVIAWRVYNPNQELTADLAHNFLIGAGVGAESSVLMDAARAPFARRGGRATTQPRPEAAEVQASNAVAENSRIVMGGRR